MEKRSYEPFLWALFSTGGVVSALLMPALLFFFGLAFPLGWLEAPGHEAALGLLRHPLGRATFFFLCSLSLFHWAHRFRFTLYDGLQIKHLNELINALCYGGAILGTALAGYLVWRIS